MFLPLYLFLSFVVCNIIPLFLINVTKKSIPTPLCYNPHPFARDIHVWGNHAVNKDVMMVPTCLIHLAVTSDQIRKADFHFPFSFVWRIPQMGKHKKAGLSLLESFMYSNGDAGDNGKLYWQGDKQYAFHWRSFTPLCMCIDQEEQVPLPDSMVWVFIRHVEWIQLTFYVSH